MTGPVDKSNITKSRDTSDFERKIPVSKTESTIPPAAEILQQASSQPASKSWFSNLNINLWNTSILEEEYYTDEDYSEEEISDAYSVEEVESVQESPAQESSKKVTQTWTTWLASTRVGRLTIGQLEITQARKEESNRTSISRIQSAFKNDSSGYIEFSKTIEEIILKLLDQNLGTHEEYKGIYHHHRDTLQDLVEVNLAKGFANLAEQAANRADEKSKTIPNYRPQSALVNVISFLCEKVQSSSPVRNAALHLNENDIYSLIADEFMTALFPNKFQELEMGWQSIVKFVGNRIDVNSMVQTTIKDILRVQLAPMLMPALESHTNKVILETSSGSPLFGQIAGQAAKDLFDNLPYFIGSYRDISVKIFKDLAAGTDPNEEQTLKMTNAIQELVKQSKKFPIKNKDILQAYEKAMGEKFDEKISTQRALILTQIAANDVVGGVAINPKVIVKNPENIVASLANIVPDLVNPTKMINAIHESLKQSKKLQITNNDILDAYTEVLVEELTKKLIKNFRHEKMQILKQNKAKDVVKGIITTPENIIASLTEILPHLDEPVKREISNVVQALTQGNSELYHDVAGIMGQYLEGVMVRLFLRVANKNPAVKDANGIVTKDSFQVIHEKLTRIVSEKIKTVVDRKSIGNIAKELNDEIMETVFGISVEKGKTEALADLPLPLQGIVHDKIRESIKELVDKAIQNASQLANESARNIPAAGGIKKNLLDIKNELKNVGMNEAGEAYAVILANDLGKMALPKGFKVINEVMGDNYSFITNVISRSTEGTLEDYAKNHLRLANALLNYNETGALKSTLDTSLKGLDPNLPKEINDIAGKMVGNALLAPLNNLFSSIIKFEQDKGAAKNQEIMAGILDIVADHIYKRREAIPEGGSLPLAHKAFAHHGELHAAVPVTKITYEKSIEAIQRVLGQPIKDEKKRELRNLIKSMVEIENRGAKVFDMQHFFDGMQKIGINLDGPSKQKLLAQDEVTGLKIKSLIRQEASQLQVQRQEKGFQPISKPLMDLMFPNGKEDLYFVQDEFKEVVWKQLRTNLFPMILQMAVEMIFDKNTMTQIVLSSLEATRDNLSGPITFGQPVKTNPKLVETGGKIMGAFLNELEFSTLPDYFIKNYILDSEDNVLPYVAEAVGNSLSGVFNQTFFKDKLATALRSAIGGDKIKDRKPVIAADQRPREVLDKEKAARLEQMNNDLSRVLREVVDVSIAYKPRQIYQRLKNDYTNWMNKFFGNRGEKFAKACIDVFEFVIFKILSSVISLMIYPFKLMAKEYLYSNMLKLDKNKELLLDLLTKIPEDQPEKKDYPIYHEDMIYKMLDFIQETASKGKAAK